jgi:hypothetical protein
LAGTLTESGIVMLENNDLRAAVIDVRDAAKDVAKPGGWENAAALDAIVAQRIGTIGTAIPSSAVHLEALRGIVWEKCDAWQKARAQEEQSGGLESVRLAAHQDAEDLVAHSDAFIASLK